MRCLKIVGVTAVGAIIANILDYYGCNRLWPELVALNTGIILGKMDWTTRQIQKLAPAARRVR